MITASKLFALRVLTMFVEVFTDQQAIFNLDLQLKSSDEMRDRSHPAFYIVECNTGPDLRLISGHIAVDSDYTSKWSAANLSISYQGWQYEISFRTNEKGKLIVAEFDQQVIEPSDQH